MSIRNYHVNFHLSFLESGRESEKIPCGRDMGYPAKGGQDESMKRELAESLQRLFAEWNGLPNEAVHVEITSIEELADLSGGSTAKTDSNATAKTALQSTT